MKMVLGVINELKHGARVPGRSFLAACTEEWRGRHIYPGCGGKPSLRARNVLAFAAVHAARVKPRCEGASLVCAGVVEICSPTSAGEFVVHVRLWAALYAGSAPNTKPNQSWVGMLLGLSVIHVLRKCACFMGRRRAGIVAVQKMFLLCSTARYLILRRPATPATVGVSPTDAGMLDIFSAAAVGAL